MFNVNWLHWRIKNFLEVNEEHLTVRFNTVGKIRVKKIMT